MELQELIDAVTKAVGESGADFARKAEQAFAEAKRAGDISAETKVHIDKVALEHNTLAQALDALKAQMGDVEQAVAVMPSRRQIAAAASAGSQVVAFEALKAYVSKVQGNERSSISIPVKAALTSPDLDPSIVGPQRLPGIDVLPKPRLFVRDLIAGGRTTSPAIFWVQMTGFTNNADAVAENTAKPYSAIDFEPKISPVRTIAHLFKASKQILDDFAQLQSMIDAEMRFGLKQVEENELLFGSGTGQHLHGIIPQATAYSPTGIPGGGSATLLDHLRWSMLQCEVALVPATGIVLHMADWARLELAKDSTGRYLIGNPQGTTAPSLWGLPVVATSVAAMAGKFLTGSFQNGAQLFDREDANVVISSENADDFEKNMLTIRCEERLALIVKRPQAFVIGDTDGTAPGA